MNALDVSGACITITTLFAWINRKYAGSPLTIGNGCRAAFFLHSMRQAAPWYVSCVITNFRHRSGASRDEREVHTL
jgi:hypothetical protein